MKIEITDTFTSSIKRLIWREHWVYKLYSLFQHKIPLFVKNIWRFRKELGTHEWWDYTFTLSLLERSLTIMEKGMHGGNEVFESREPKLKSMQRVLELLHNQRENNYIQRVEDELGDLLDKEWEFEENMDKPGYHTLLDNRTPEEKEHNEKVFKRAHEIENKEWIEIWNIIKGTKNSKKCGEKYDGTDMRGWWD